MNPQNAATDDQTDVGGPKPGQVKLRKMLQGNRAIVCPGVYDGLTGRIALAQGFECLHLSAAATRMARSGVLDPEEISDDSVVELAETLQQIDKDVPLFAEVDNSLDTEAVKEVLAQFHDTGIAALQLEDESAPPCAGENFAQTRAAANALIDRLQAAVDERSRLGSDIVIIAKTKMAWSCTCRKCFASAERLLQDAVEVGADVVFPAGLIKSTEVENMARKTFKGVATMRAPQTATTKDMQKSGIKIISYPELFTIGLLEGISSDMRDFRLTGGLGAMSKTPKPFEPKDMGGLRGLLVFEKKK
jgi:2-methylisocitrate lyase-like PEP mutase family enzyme